MPLLQAVILDVDGTLVDSNDAHARAWAEALAEQGYQVAYQRVRELIGMGGDNLLPAVAGLDKQRDPGRQIAQRRGEIFKARYLEGVQALPGARGLVERLRADGLQLIVASSAAADELEPLLARAGVAELLPARTSAEQAASSKPSPDIVQAALEQLGLPAQHALMIGDTPYDLQAAQQAGVALIALRSGGWRDAELAGALAIYDHPADLLAHYDDSPLAALRAR